MGFTRARQPVDLSAPVCTARPRSAQRGRNRPSDGDVAMIGYGPAIPDSLADAAAPYAIAQLNATFAKPKV
jgi:hypothetical protein